MNYDSNDLEGKSRKTKIFFIILVLFGLVSIGYIIGYILTPADKISDVLPNIKLPISDDSPTPHSNPSEPENLKPEKKEQPKSKGKAKIRWTRDIETVTLQAKKGDIIQSYYAKEKKGVVHYYYKDCEVVLSQNRGSELYIGKERNSKKYTTDSIVEVFDVRTEIQLDNENYSFMETLSGTRTYRNGQLVDEQLPIKK